MSKVALMDKLGTCNILSWWTLTDDTVASVEIQKMP